MTLISELLDLPPTVNRGDFVLKLSEGISDEQAELTLRQYVVTENLKRNFEDALRFIKGAVDTRSSKGSYLHGTSAVDQNSSLHVQSNRGCEQLMRSPGGASCRFLYFTSWTTMQRPSHSSEMSGSRRIACWPAIQI